jgi:hypothetical protein
MTSCCDLSACESACECTKTTCITACAKPDCNN